MSARSSSGGPHLLGVDGGNTKTVALVARGDGTIVGAERALGGSDIYAMPAEAALEAIRGVAEAALRAAGAAAVTAAAFSLAGADWPEDIALLRDGLRGRWPDPVVVNDAIGALRATIPSGPGVVVVCGTGAATGARGPGGRTWHSSFWQEPQGAYEIGIRALHAVVRAELGIDRPTALTELLLAAAGEPDVESLLHRIKRRGARERHLVAGFTPAVMDAAERGDATATAIVREHGVALGETALAAARRVGIDDGRFSLALAGGVLRHAGDALRETIVATVLADAPKATIVQPMLEPAAGALLLAFDAARIPVTDDIADRLRSTFPPAELFDTHRVAAGPAAGG